MKMTQHQERMEHKLNCSKRREELVKRDCVITYGKVEAGLPGDLLDGKVISKTSNGQGFTSLSIDSCRF